MASIILGILPAPNNIQYSEDPAGHLQIFWEPPTLVSDELSSQNDIVRIDSRITHFESYITTEESTIVYKSIMLQGHLSPLKMETFRAVSGFRWQQ